MDEYNKPLTVDADKIHMEITISYNDHIAQSYDHYTQNTDDFWELYDDCVNNSEIITDDPYPVDTWGEMEWNELDRIIKELDKREEDRKEADNFKNARDAIYDVS